MSDLRLNNKICLEGKIQTGRYTTQEPDMQCYKYQVTLIKVNRGVRKAQRCYSLLIILQFLFLFHLYYFNIYVFIILSKYIQNNINRNINLPVYMGVKSVAYYSRRNL